MTCSKHLLKSASATEIILDNIASQFFNIKKQDELYFKPQVLATRKSKKVLLHVPQYQVQGIRGLQDMNLLNTNIQKVSRIRGFSLEIVNKDKNEIFPITIMNGNRGGYFTLQFLYYIKQHGFELDEEDNYVFDVTELNYKTTPIVKYEKTEFDFNVLSNEFAKLVSSRKYVVQNGRRTSEFTAEVLVQKLFDFLNKKLDINIKKIETLVYGFTAMDLDTDNYDLGRNSKYLDLVGLKYAIDNRSIGGSFGWSRLLNKIFNPYLLEDKHKPDHPLDVLFKPNEVVDYYKHVYPRIKDGKK